MDKIIPSFSSSLFDGSKESIGDIVELGIDSFLENGTVLFSIFHFLI